MFLTSSYLNVVPCKPFMWDHCILQDDIARSHMHMTCKISFNRATKMKTEIQNKMKMATEKTPNMHFVPTYYLHWSLHTTTPTKRMLYASQIHAHTHAHTHTYIYIYNMHDSIQSWIMYATDVPTMFFWKCYEFIWIFPKRNILMYHKHVFCNFAKESDKPEHMKTRIKG